MSPPSPQEAPGQHSSQNEMTRKEFFRQTQIVFQNTATFEKLKDKCRALENKFSEWPILCEVVDNVPSLDLLSVGVMPEELLAQYLPVAVDADGNCFCRAISLLATGTAEHHTEIRVRIVAEMALNEDYVHRHRLSSSSIFRSRRHLSFSLRIFPSGYRP